MRALCLCKPPPFFVARLAGSQDAAACLSQYRAFAGRRRFVRQDATLKSGIWRGLMRGGIHKVRLFGKVRREASAVAFGNPHFLDWGATPKALTYVFCKVRRNLPDRHPAICAVGRPCPTDLLEQALENTAFYISCFSQVPPPLILLGV